MNLKKMVGIKAAGYVKEGMIVGLGTGSTAYYMVEEIGRRVKEEKLKIIGVTTSSATAKQAEKLAIPLKGIDQVSHVDVTIDGADEISADFQGIKGGGAALLFEKIVATYSRHNIWIVDDSKMVDKLGRFPLPIEVIPYGSAQLLQLFDQKGLHPVLRLTDRRVPLETDSSNYIIDLHLGQLETPHELALWLNNQPGVVEHGLFLDVVSTIIVGREDGAEVINVPQ